MAKSKALEWLEEDNLIRIEGWARDGLTEEQIAHNMGIGLSTLKEWKNKLPALLAALKRGKEVTDFIVENALYRNAIGYERQETVIDAKGNEHVITKFYPPNTTAQIFWLKNRRPDKWRDKREQETEAVIQGGICLLPEQTDLDGVKDG